MKKKQEDLDDDILPEYDFDYSKAVWGKHYKRILTEGSNIVFLDKDVAKAFPNSESVNEALRRVLKSKPKASQAVAADRGTRKVKQTKKSS